MKKMMKIFIILCVTFIYKSVYADTTLKVGETVTIFSNAACNIATCTSNNSFLTLEVNGTECKGTGVSVGDSQITVTCDDGLTKNINVKVVDVNNVGTTTQASSLYESVENATVNCSSLGLLRKDLQSIFTVFKILAPILVVVFSTYDFIKAFTGKVEGESKKVFMKLLKRLVFAMILFFLPAILDFFLALVDPSYSTCINN